MCSPKTLYEYGRWQIDRIYRLNYLKEEMKDEDKHYAIRKHFGLSQKDYEV